MRAALRAITSSSTKSGIRAAYDVRANLKEDYLAAILVDRGDRHSWTGDAYLSQAASLAAFGNYDFILKNLRYTAVRSNGIESYELILDLKPDRLL